MPPITIDASARELENWVLSVTGPAPNFKGASYLEEYLRLMQEHLSSTRLIVELGVAEGASLLAWSRLCPNARIIGVDHQLEPRIAAILDVLGLDGRVSLLDLDHNDPDRIAAAIDAPIDLLIDDGSHLLEPTRRCFLRLFDLVRPGGWYCIEDWGAGYWESFGGPETGVHRLIHELIDEIALEDRMKPEAGAHRAARRDPLPIDEIRVKGVEPIVFIRKKSA